MTDLKKLLEPTEEMIDAALEAIGEDEDPELREILTIEFKAMISKSEIIAKLLAVVEAAKDAKRGQYRGLCADRLDEAIETLDD